MSTNPLVVRHVSDLPEGFAVRDLPELPAPSGVLVCPPDEFDVVDIKNPYMEDALGTVDGALARRQWDALCDAFEGLGLDVERMDPLPGCEDMVFCANTAFTGPDAAGKPLALVSRMRHESRRREVPAIADWLAGNGHRAVAPLPPEVFFEGGGDALWHPGRRLVWAGHGRRSSPESHAAVAAAFDVPVVSLTLSDPNFYHLDTCLCLLDETTALVATAAFDEDGLALIRELFPEVIDADAEEAVTALACNAASFPGRGVVVERRARRTALRVAALGHDVVEVDTGEFLKSGGSVYCMKQSLFAAAS